MNTPSAYLKGWQLWKNHPWESKRRREGRELPRVENHCNPPVRLGKKKLHDPGGRLDRGLAGKKALSLYLITRMVAAWRCIRWILLAYVFEGKISSWRLILGPWSVAHRSWVWFGNSSGKRTRLAVYVRTWQSQKSSLIRGRRICSIRLRIWCIRSSGIYIYI